jgi:hypothetical protein
MCVAAESTFAGNVANKGGALSLTSRLPVEIGNCIFTGNVATGESTGGNGGCGGAVFLQGSPTPHFTNCTFSQNEANCNAGGGAIFARINSRSILTNSVFWGNTPDELSADSTSEIEVNYCDVQGGWDGPGAMVLDADPLFVNPIGADKIRGTADDDLRVAVDSPVVDAGHNWYLPADALDLDADADTHEFVPFDFDGGPRVADASEATGAGCGAPAITDMGAYERAGAPWALIAGDVNGDGLVDQADLLEILLSWGPYENCALADLDLDGCVGMGDVLFVLPRWR